MYIYSVHVCCVAQSLQHDSLLFVTLLLQTAVNIRKLSCVFILWYATQFCLYPGSKNPDITLKIAEIRTDSLGKVSACSVPQRNTREFFREMFTYQLGVVFRLSARRKRSCLFPSLACSLVQNTSPELDGQKTADSKFLL